MNNSYNYFCNKRAFYEDAPDEPIWLDYYKEFHDRKEGRLRQKMQEFKRTHPNLTFSHGNNWIKEVKVLTGPVLFTDDRQEYREIKYTFNVYYYGGYYEPSKELDSWLRRINEMTAWMKHKKLVRLCKLNPDMDLEQITGRLYGL